MRFLVPDLQHCRVTFHRELLSPRVTGLTSTTSVSNWQYFSRLNFSAYCRRYLVTLLWWTKDLVSSWKSRSGKAISSLGRFV